MLCADWFIHQLHQACEGAALRGSRVISAEDILFLMRRDKVNKTHTLNKHTHMLWTHNTYNTGFLLIFMSLSLDQRKVARLLKYLQFRDYKSKLLKTVEDDETQQDTGTYIYIYIKQKR